MHVAVIGGGLAGLSASIALAGEGIPVSLYEKAPRLGGRATSYVLPDGEQIDNCQHVTLGCCVNLADFYRRIGVAEKIEYFDRLVFADSTGGRGYIQLSRLPAPFHLAPSFASFSLLTLRDRRAIARAMLRIIVSGGRPKLPPMASMMDWLKIQRQTPQAIDRFWRTVLVSALNEDLDRIDARFGIDVFWKAFISNPAGFPVGLPTVPLAELYDASQECLQRSNGRARTRCGASEIVFENGEVSSVRLDDGSEVKAEYYIAAVTIDRLMKMLPDGVRAQEPFANLQNLKPSPITSVHLWFDRPVMRERFVASLDQTIQWVFNRTGEYLQIVISASHGLAQRSQQQIVDLCRSDLAKMLPETASAELKRSIVVREASATFSPEPGCDRWRPPQKTPIRNLLLAGDWTQTGWPATMEGAVRSGYLAAEAILGTRFVKDELRPAGLAHWLSP